VVADTMGISAIRAKIQKIGKTKIAKSHFVKRREHAQIN
jgi:hypothetical protein